MIEIHKIQSIRVLICFLNTVGTKSVLKAQAYRYVIANTCYKRGHIGHIL